MRSVLLVLAAAVFAGCSDPFSPQALSGAWVRESGVPGNSSTMSLTVDGSSVIGSGHQCGEALGCSAFSVAGTLDDNGDVRLDFNYPNARVEHFVGRVWFGALRGTATNTDEMPVLPPGSSRYAVVFHRAQVITPN